MVSNFCVLFKESCSTPSYSLLFFSNGFKVLILTFKSSIQFGTDLVSVRIRR